MWVRVDGGFQDLVEKLMGRCPLGRPRYTREEDSIKIDFKKIDVEVCIITSG